jgi:signal transduction histidine kinase
MTLYRAAQEGLTNAQKHAAATRVDVTLDFGPASVRLAVRDDGAGHAEGGGSGFGLAGLAERAELLGGTFTAAARLEGGFALELELPVTDDTKSG